jgi:hypothetical protein
VGAGAGVVSCDEDAPPSPMPNVSARVRHMPEETSTTIRQHTANMVPRNPMNHPIPPEDPLLRFAMMGQASGM